MRRSLHRHSERCSTLDARHPHALLRLPPCLHYAIGVRTPLDEQVWVSCCTTPARIELNSRVAGGAATDALSWRALAEQAWGLAKLYYEGPEKQTAIFNMAVNLALQAAMSLLHVVVSYTQARLLRA